MVPNCVSDSATHPTLINFLFQVLCLMILKWRLGHVGVFFQKANCLNVFLHVTSSENYVYGLILFAFVHALGFTYIMIVFKVNFGGRFRRIPETMYIAGDKRVHNEPYDMDQLSYF